MESLSDTVWDIVIAGTGLPQALLALSLSRSDKKVLHVDKNEYYGGHDAAFSLRDAEEWTKAVNDSTNLTKFRNAQINIPERGPDEIGSKLVEQSRKYTLSLSPQLIYAQSKLLSALVSSRVHTQLEFQAVGSWWVYRDSKLQRIPSGREDVFADETLSRKDKITLMKFLRSVVKEPDPEDSGDPEEDILHDDRPLSVLLESDFKVSPHLQQPLLALSLSRLPAAQTKASYALPRIKRHMTSIGAFGPGFGAVLSKYGGNAEIAQVGCRAGAVGGGVYVLGAGVAGRLHSDDPNLARISLSTGETITTSYLIGSMDDLSRVDWQGNEASLPNEGLVESIHLVAIVSSPLKDLFPKTSESGPFPAGAVVLVDKTDGDGNPPPVYLQVHSEDTGECPAGQCIIYASVDMLESNREDEVRDRLRNAVEQTIQACDADASILWELRYTSVSSTDRSPTPASFTLDSSGRIIAFPALSEDIAFDDSLLNSVEAAWKKVMGPLAEESDFLRFPERPGEENED